MLASHYFRHVSFACEKCAEAACGIIKQEEDLELADVRPLIDRREWISMKNLAVQELRCPKDNKKLAEVRDDYFDAADEKDKYRNKGKLFIKCPECKRIIGF